MSLLIPASFYLWLSITPQSDTTNIYEQLAHLYLVNFDDCDPYNFVC
jgi:hypothetical protein